MKFKTIFSKFIIAIMVLALSASFGSSRVYADAYKVVTLGGDLTNDQKEDMLKYFGVTRQDANVIEVNIDEERKYLGNIATSQQIATKSISSSDIERWTECEYQ